MRALQVAGPGAASVIDRPVPESRPDEVLLKVRMVGMCGSDLNTFRGTNPLVTYPRILGHEVASTVLRAAEGAKQLPAGTSVTLSPYTSCGVCAACRRNRPNACRFNETLGVQRDGAMAEFISMPAHKIHAAGDLSFQELALVEPLTVGFHAAARGRVSAGDTVAVFGCGGVGLGAIAGAAARGATVIGVDIDEAKIGLGRQAGATHAINSQTAGLHDSLQELTAGHGPDVVIEAAGTPATFRAAVEEVAFTGRVVYIGYAKEPVAYETRLFVQKELDILGSRNALPNDFEAVIEMLKRRKFPVAQAISKIVSIEDAPQALSRWSAAPAGVGKILVAFD